MAENYGITDSTVLPATPREIYNRNLLERALPALIHAFGAQFVDIPQNAGDKPTFEVFESLPLGTEIIGGVNPEPVQLSKRTEQTELRIFGAYVQPEEKFRLTIQDKVLTKISTLLGENAGQTLDSVYMEEHHAGSNYLLAGSVAARVNVNTPLTAAEMKTIPLTLRNANAEPWAEMINPTTGVATQPVAEAYLGITNWNALQVIADTLTATYFLPVEKYANPSHRMPNEAGAITNGVTAVRILCSTRAKVFTDAGATSKDVHTLVTKAKNAFGITKLRGEGLKNIIKSAEQAGGPLSLYGTSGWRAILACLILNDDFLHRSEFTLT